MNHLYCRSRLESLPWEQRSYVAQVLKEAPELYIVRFKDHRQPWRGFGCCKYDARYRACVKPLSVFEILMRAEPGAKQPYPRMDGCAVFSKGSDAVSFVNALKDYYPPGGYGTTCALITRADGFTEAHWHVGSAD